MDIMQFISQDLIILVIALWFIGYMLKSTNKIPDSAIPFIITAFGIAAVMIMHGPTMEALLQGIICAALAVYGQNIIKQALEFKGITDSKEDSENKSN